ncbi:glycosyltransferase family 4 protein [Candidatus Omnitrophota bacterium]
MKVCFIYNNEYLPTASTNYYEYMQSFAKIGVEIYVICATFNSSKLHIEKTTYGNISVYEIPVRTTLKRDILSTTAFGGKAFKLAKKIYDMDKFDILHIRAFPDTGFLLVPLWAKMKKSCSLVLDVRAAAMTNWAINLFSRIMIIVQSIFFQNVIIIDRKMLNLIRISKNKVTEIPLGVNLRRFYAVNNNEARNKLRMKLTLPLDRFICVYCGNMRRARKIEVILKSFKRALDSHKNVQLLFIGGGCDNNYVKYLKRFCHEIGINKNVTFVGLIPFKEVAHYLAASDVGLAFITNTVQYRFQPAFKTVEYLASGLAVIATATPGNAVYIENYKNGILVGDDEKSYAEGLSSIISDVNLRLSFASAARDSIKEFDYDTIVRNKLIPFYERILRLNL